ncbi:MAG: hypothetical protein RLZZ141_2291 [Pseudomonadota bacterium]
MKAPRVAWAIYAKIRRRSTGWDWSTVYQAITDLRAACPSVHLESQGFAAMQQNTGP